MCPFVYGHMPVFSSDFANKDVTGKSWALYETIDAGEEILLGLNIQAHENLSFSVNIPYSETFEENVTYINVSVTGHNASQIDCDPKFDGWRVLSGTHGGVTVVDQTKIIPTTKLEEPLHFEPFGVGYYRKLAACQGPVPVGDTFNVSITAVKKLQINVGVGMAESFSFTDIITMSIWILQTWIWDGYLLYWIAVSLGSLGQSVYYNRDLLRQVIASKSVQLYDTKEATNALVRAVLIFNALQFSARLVIINLNGYNRKVGAEILATLFIHICLPLAVAWYWQRVTQNLLAYVVLLVYSSSLLWQGFFVLPVFCLWQILWGLRVS